MKYIIANWKANKTLSEALDWIKTFNKTAENNTQIKENLNTDKLSVIIALPHPFIHPLKDLVSLKNVYIGTQDISSIEEGNYTGEITAKMLTPTAKFSLIGHSERRQNFNENEETIGKKIRIAKKYEIEPILCIRNLSDKFYEEVNFIAYEPVDAIGTGENKSVNEVIEIKEHLSFSKNVKFIYGGSVNEKNCHEYLKDEEIDGVLVGTASLDPHSFSLILAGV